MGGGFQIDPDGLQWSAQRLRMQHDELAAATRRLRQRLDGLGDVAGDDHPGRAFAVQYQAHRDDVVRALDVMVTALDQVADGLSTMVSRYLAADAASTVTVGGRGGRGF